MVKGYLKELSKPELQCKYQYKPDKDFSLIPKIGKRGKEFIYWHAFIGKMMILQIMIN